ncbi:MAG TPA: hypothetical protein PLM08_25115, partial [Polyangiaceae bacterium]|nr:hypothetical protein [Polyangiaceae bacterium]
MRWSARLASVFSSSVFSTIRSVALGLAILASVVLIGVRVHAHYPVQEWLFWRYLSYWGWMALLSVSCSSVGHRVMSWIFPRRLPLGEHLVLSFALGVFVFFVGMFLLGVSGALGGISALVLPLLLLASGAFPLGRSVLRVIRHLRAWRARPRPSLSLWRYPILALGLLSIAALYFVLISPANISYDARWYHLSIAEHYAAYGGIDRFDEGWFQGTNPHLGSWLYTWAFTLPGTRLFDRAMLCAHLEFLLFLWTLASVSPLVRRLLHGVRSPLAWVAMFLFPGLFLYDSNLSVGADHVGAFWAIPIYLAVMRAWSKPSPSRLSLAAIFVSGALLSKYTVIILAVGPILALIARTLWVGTAALLRKSKDVAKDAWLGIGAFALTGLVATAPHWLKNWLWHGDPVYPILYRHLAPRPWTDDSAMFYSIGIEGRLISPDGSVIDRIWQTIKIVFTFSFVPHNWPRFHGEVPVFGFLFTVSTCLLLFLRRSQRTWGLVFITWIGLATWASIHARDRYLQSILPWMVVVTAVVLVRIWKSHWSMRALLGLLVGLQLVWGGDVYFFRTHAMIHDSPVKAAVDFLATGFEKKYDERLKIFGAMEKIADHIPKKAKVLMHEEHLTLGLQRRRVNDWQGYQGGLAYGLMTDPKELHEQLVTWGVTHVVWKDAKSAAVDSVGGDLLFFDWVLRHTQDRQVEGGYRIAMLPTEAPQGPFHDEVAYLTCGTNYAQGLYHRSALHLADRVEDRKYPNPDILLEPDASNAQELIERAQYVVWNA